MTRLTAALGLSFALFAGAFAQEGSGFRTFAVPENRAARDLWREGLGLLKAGRYEAAFARLERVLRLYPNKVVPEPGGKGTRYRSLAARVAEVLAGLSREGQARYRARYEARAQKALAQALRRRDPAGLLKVWRLYPLTAAAAQALEALGDLALEAGAGRAAARHYRRAATHPARKSPLKRLRRKELFARALAGEALPGADIPAEWRRPARAPEAWPQLGGGPERARPMPPLGELPPPQWRVVLPILYETDPLFHRSDEDEAPYLPVVGGDLLYVTNGLGVWAYELADGTLRWHYPGVVPRSTDQLNPLVLLSPVLAGDRLVANLEVPVHTPEHYYHAIPIQKRIPVRRLFALEARTGRLLWSHYEGACFPPMPGALADFVRQSSVSSPPLVVGNTIYAGFSCFEGKIYEYLAAVDLPTGKVRWRTLLCTGQKALNMFGRPVEEPVLGIPAERDGVIYFTTNLGVVAAVDGEDGVIRWLTTYPRKPEQRPAMITEYRPPPGWVLSPAVVASGRVVTAPTDSTHLLCLDAATGRVLWRYPRETQGLRLKYVLGVHEGVVLASGNGLVGLDLESGRLAWPPVRLDGGEQAAWRGAVTAEEVLLPAQRRLYRFDPRTGRPLGEPAPWENPLEQAGAVLVPEPGLLITTSRVLAAKSVFLTVNYRPRERLTRLRQALERAPTPARRLAVLRTLARAGRLEAARAELEAWLARSSSPALRVRLAATRLEFLRQAVEQALARGDRRAAAALARAACGPAPTPELRVEGLRLAEEVYRALGDLEARHDLYREMARSSAPPRLFPPAGDRPMPPALYALLADAQVLLRLGRPAQALARLQEALRRFGSLPYGPGGEPFCRRGARLVAELLARHGRDLYGPYEKEAAERYRAAKEAADPAALLAVIRAYPNAAVTRRARLDYAALARRCGEFARALPVLRGGQAESPGSGSAATEAELARIYEALGFPTVAAALRGESPPEDRFPPLPPGEPVRIHRLREGPAVRLEGVASFPDGTVLVLRLEESGSEGAVLYAWPAGAPARPRWRFALPAPPSEPGRLQAWAVDNLLLLGAGGTLYALDRRTGTERWRQTAGGRTFLGGGTALGLVIALWGKKADAADGQPLLTAHELATGEPVWTQAVQGQAPLPPVCFRRFVAVTCRRPPAALHFYDAASGRLRAVHALGEGFLGVAPVRFGDALAAPTADLTGLLLCPPELGARPLSTDGLVLEGLRASPQGLLLIGSRPRGGRPGPVFLTGLEPHTGRIRWQQGLPPERAVDTGALVWAGDRWLVPVRDPLGGVALKAIQADGTTAWTVPELFPPGTFRTQLLPLGGSVLAVGFRPETPRPGVHTTHCVWLDRLRGRQRERWTVTESAAPEGVFPTPEGFVLVWPRRLEWYRCVSQDER